MNIPSFQENHISQVPALQLLQNLGFIYQWARIGALGLTLRERSNKEHIQLLREELTAFRELAEI